ncbi:MAG: hypothetical protein CW338_10615 [Clostridiales bacterium]|nr:hypothetical protein [Clostridiales bacterium]
MRKRSSLQADPAIEEKPKMKHPRLWNIVIPILLVIILLVPPALVILGEMGKLSGAPTAEVKATAPEDAGELVFVADYDYDPYSFLNGDGMPNGMDVEIAYEIANRLGLRPRIEFGTWGECKEKIRGGEADVLLGLEIFVDGAATGTIKSIPVGTDLLSIIGKDDVTDAAALAGKRVGVSFGSALMGMYPLNCEYVQYFTYTDMLIALDKGEIDYGICHASVASRLIDINGFDLRISLTLTESYPTLGIRQDEPALLERINAALEEMSADGTIARLRTKWIDTNVKNRTVWETIRNNEQFFIVYTVLAIVVLAGYIVTVTLARSSLYQKKALEMEKEQQERRKEEQIRNELAENYTRILALEDDFEALYDVELDTGRYGIFVKGQTFGDVNNNLINNNSFFDDVKKNLNVVHPEDQQGNYDSTRPEFIREALSQSDHFDRYYRLMVNGQPAWARMRIVYKDAQKKNIIIGVFDAGEEMLAKEKDERRILLNYFIDSYESAFFVDLIQNKYEILHMNPMFASFFEHSTDAEQVIRGFIGSYFHPEDREMMLQSVDPEYVMNRLKTEPSFSFTVREQLGDTEKVLRGQIIRVADEQHIAVGFMDVTKETLEQQKRLLGAIPISPDVLTKANIGMWAFELDEGHAPRMYADETMLGLIGLDHQVPPEEIYHAWYDHIDAGSYDLVADAVAKMSSGEHAEVQYPWHYDDGRTIIVRCGGIRNYEYKGGIRIEGTHQNVTQTLHFDEEERKREAQQRKDELARAKAEASDRVKTEFLFNMSHDIRTPMNAILGYTNIALNHIEEPERVSDSLKKIKTSGGHLLSLINDILEMSRIEAGRMEIINAPINIYDVTESITGMSTALAATRDVAFRTVIDDIADPYIYADELHTNQIIINLISNAIKYTNPGGEVEYRIEQLTAPADGIAKYRVTVKDNGIGMSEEFQKHLFESFSREKTSTVSRQEGAGLGLAIVKRIVDLMGGTISVQSRQGVGSVFTMELPLKVMDEAAVAAYKAQHGDISEPGEAVSLRGRKVLLVEDNEMNREIATEILEETGMIIDPAEDGAAAVRKVAGKGAGYYDFILMDIQMPVMNGYEATAAIRALPGGDRIPIIALSANAFKEDVDKSVAAGMNDHVAKPIDIKELFTTLAKFL